MNKNIFNKAAIVAENLAWSARLSVAHDKGYVGPNELDAFFESINAKVTATYLEKYPDTKANHYTLKLKIGMKFAKLVRVRGIEESGSVYAFIDLTNGDILKPASWKAPAKHARGNIRVGGADNWWGGAMDYVSVAYLN